jgi:hypothetical protein
MDEKTLEAILELLTNLNKAIPLIIGSIGWSKTYREILVAALGAGVGTEDAIRTAERAADVVQAKARQLEQELAVISGDGE